MEPVRRLAPGLAIVIAISLAALLLSRLPQLSSVGLSALTLAIIVGAVLGNVAHHRLVGPTTQPGLHFAQKTLLRLGVALYGLNLSVAQIVHVGPAAIAVDLFTVITTVVVAWWVGYRWLRMDRETVLLTASGSAICGAAAVVAAESVLGAAPHKTSAAVGQVVLYGSIAMLVYPLLFGMVHVGREPFGIYVGSTVHEVAQVVAIGKTIGGTTAGDAVIVKMIRVMLLAPFLVVLGRFRSPENGTAPGTAKAPKLRVPAFAIWFIVIALVHPYLGIPDAVLNVLRTIDIYLLAAAMAALGLDTTIKKLRVAGREALILGGILFGYLIVGGGIANVLIQRLFGVSVAFPV